MEPVEGFVPVEPVDELLDEPVEPVEPVDEVWVAEDDEDDEDLDPLEREPPLEDLLPPLLLVPLVHLFHPLHLPSVHVCQAFSP